MEEFNIYEVAEENNLDVISTTTGKNGYPQSVRYAITGFPNFSEAEKLAEKYGLRIYFLEKSRLATLCQRPQYDIRADGHFSRKLWR